MLQNTPALIILSQQQIIFLHWFVDFGQQQHSIVIVAQPLSMPYAKSPSWVYWHSCTTKYTCMLQLEISRFSVLSACKHVLHNPTFFKTITLTYQRHTVHIYNTCCMCACVCVLVCKYSINSSPTTMLIDKEVSVTDRSQLPLSLIWGLHRISGIEHDHYAILQSGNIWRGIYFGTLAIIVKNTTLKIYQ